MTSDQSLCIGDRLSKHYGETIALADCSLELQRGEILGLAGQNGAGKTTLAKLIAGFLQPTEGSVTVGGVAPTAFRKAFGIGYLPEELSIFANCNANELLRMRATHRDVVSREELLDLLEISESLLYRPLRTLSKGQRRTVHLAYAALGPSRLIILDEPDSGLDPSALDRLRRVIRLCASKDAAVAVLSHQLQELEDVCDRIMFLKAGRQIGVHSRDEIIATGVRNLYRQLAG